MPEPKNLIIASPSEQFRASLAEALENEPDFRLTGATDNGDQLMEMIHSASPDAAVLDPTIHGLCGQELLGRILSSEPRPVVLIANAPPDRALRDFLAAHADVFPCCPSEPDAIRSRLKVLLNPDAAEPALTRRLRMETILAELQIFPWDTGSSYLCDTIALFSAGSPEIRSLTDAFAHIAKRSGVSANAVKKAVTAVIRDSFPRTDDLTREKYFGPAFVGPEKKPPTVLHFVNIVAERLGGGEEASPLEERVNAVIRDLGIPERRTGRRLLRDALLLFLQESPGSIHLMDLYRRLGEKHGMSVAGVLKGLQTVIAEIPGCCDAQVLERYFGPGFFGPSDPPSTRRFLDTLSDRLLRDSAPAPDPQTPGSLETQVADALRQAGVTPWMKGYPYLLDTILLYIHADPQQKIVIHQLYMEVAARRGVAWKQVETGIWNLLERQAPPGPEGTPSARAFIARIGDQVRGKARDPDSRIAAALGELGIPAPSVGHLYVKQAVLLYRKEGRTLAEVPRLPGVYEAISEESGCNPVSVRLHVRQAVTGALASCDPKVLEKYFGGPVFTPHSTEAIHLFLATLAARVRSEEDPDAPPRKTVPGHLEARVAVALFQAGLRASQKGFGYLLETLTEYLRADTGEQIMLEHLYVAVARRYHVPWTQIEKKIHPLLERLDPQAADDPWTSTDEAILFQMGNRVRTTVPFLDPDSRAAVDLQELGVTPHTEGHRYLKQAVLAYSREGITLGDPPRLTRLYAELSGNHVTRKKVQDIIRQSVAGVLDGADPRLLEKYFGGPVPLPSDSDNAIHLVLATLALRSGREDRQTGAAGHLEARVYIALCQEGLTPARKGYGYLLDTILLYLRQDSPQKVPIRQLYARVAEQRHGTWQQVEKGIQHLLEEREPDPDGSSRQSTSLQLILRVADQVRGNPRVADQVQGNPRVVDQVQRNPRDLDSRADAVLREFGIAAPTALHHYLKQTLLLCASEDCKNAYPPPTKNLYQEIADRNRVTRNAAQKAIHQGVARTLAHTDPQLLAKYFGGPVSVQSSADAIRLFVLPLAARIRSEDSSST